MASGYLACKFRYDSTDCFYYHLGYGDLFHSEADFIYPYVTSIWEKIKSLNDRPGERLKNMLFVAFGQKKMFKRPLPAILHFFIYAGFLIINLEVLEFVIDGLAGTHRIFAPFLGVL